MQHPPRGAGRHNATYRLSDIYETFKYKEQVPYTLYRLIIEAYWKKVIQHIIEDSGIYKMAFRFGHLRVRKKRMRLQALQECNQLRIDYAVYNKTGKIAYHLNDHRKHHTYKIMWDKRKAGPIVNKGVFRYIATRTMKRRLAWILKNDFKKDYYE